jgi:uridine kinase
MATASIRTVIKRDGSKVPFDQSRIKCAIRKAILAEEPNQKYAHDTEKSAEHEAVLFTDDVVKGLHAACNGDDTLHIERIQDVILEVLHRDLARGRNSISTRPESLWMSFMLYREGHAMVRNGLLSKHHFRPVTKPIDKLAELREWNRQHRCGTVDELNEWYSGKGLHHLIQAAEERSTDELMAVACRLDDAMCQGGLRAMIITGPSSSGKTVTSRKAVKLLSQIRPDIGFKSLEMDNYYRGGDNHEKIAYMVDGKVIEDKNVELPETYDLELINEHLEALLRGDTVMVPRYDFKTSIRVDNQVPFRLEKNEVLLIDCLHALSPQLTEAIPAENKFKLYIEPLSMLEDKDSRPVYLTDIRLLRRMLRDARTRGYPMPATLWHWHLVRKGERFILPYLYSADMVVDTGLPYELPIFKRYLENEITAILPMLERNPDLFDARERARRVLRLFRQMEAATKNQIASVPSDSILREFIGGSQFFKE